MKRLLAAAVAIVGLSAGVAAAQMGTGQGGGMMGGGSVWGMNSGWLFGIVIVVLAILATVVLMNRK